MELLRKKDLANEKIPILCKDNFVNTEESANIVCIKRYKSHYLLSKLAEVRTGKSHEN